MHTKLNKIKNNSQKESHFNPHKYKIKIIQPTIPFQFITRNRIRKNKFSLSFHSPSRHSVFLIVPSLYSSPRRPIFSSKFVSSIRVSIKNVIVKIVQPRSAPRFNFQRYITYPFDQLHKQWIKL